MKDVHLIGLDFIDGNPISKGIPWNNFSELEIQAILNIHFETLGYRVIWRHKEDPANERGIDLECIRIKDNKKITIAVKKKPKKEDLGQLLELSQDDANQKIYVCIGGATQSFRDQMPKFQQKIEFWDEKTLEEKLMESYLTFKLLIDNTYTNYSIQEIKEVLHKAITSPVKPAFPKLNQKIFRLLWSMKDRAVTLNKCSQMLQLLFEDSSRFGKLHQSQIQNLVLWCFDELYSTSLFALHDSFRSLPKEVLMILQLTYEKTGERSNWLYLFSYPPRFIPGALDSLINKDTTDSELEEIQKMIESSNPQSDLLDEAAREFRLLSGWGYGLEETIDDMFLECLNELRIK